MHPVPYSLDSANPDAGSHHCSGLRLHGILGSVVRPGVETVMPPPRPLRAISLEARKYARREAVRPSLSSPRRRVSPNLAISLVPEAWSCPVSIARLWRSHTKDRALRVGAGHGGHRWGAEGRVVASRGEVTGRASSFRKQGSECRASSAVLMLRRRVPAPSPLCWTPAS